MNIIAVTSCTSGLAHTYIAKERLETSAEELGISIAIETQGAIGIENPLSDEAIERASAVLIATDIDIIGVERFRNKFVMTIPVNKAVRFPTETLKDIIRGVQENYEKNI